MTAPSPLLEVGALIRTNYKTGPYRVTHVHGPCTCPEYVRSLDGDDTPSEPHYHLTCASAEAPGNSPKRFARGFGGPYFLAGFRPDGSSVWSSDRIELVEAVQVRLFR